mmetsp:Transcript_26605/g.94917  ORF Transcript_26605/g.94917 Transcript_26605/m.94917 type:complete len:358 (-) Transcript_26605:22-1095(-)
MTSFPSTSASWRRSPSCRRTFGRRRRCKGRALSPSLFNAVFRTLACRSFPAALRAGGAAWRLLSLGPARGGLPLHAHGETWLAVVHGAKRWFAYAPGKGPSRETLAKIHPLASTLHWARAVEDAALTAPAEAPLSCVQNAGDVVYLPAGWKHATLNLAETIAVGEQASYPAQERLATALGALRLNPHDVEALHGAGVATAHRAFETGAAADFRSAVAYLRRAVAERPLQPEVSLILAEVLNAAGSPRHADRAIDDCRAAYAAGGDELIGAPSARALAAVHLKFARFRLNFLQWRRALSSLGDALALWEGYAEALKDRAFAHEMLGDFQRAIRDLEKALARAPADPEVSTRLARLRTP